MEDEFQRMKFEFTQDQTKTNDELVQLRQTNNVRLVRISELRVSKN